MINRHIPVMLDEALEALSPRDGGVYLDATFGAGGYSRAMLAQAACVVIALDQDPRVQSLAEAVRGAHGGRLAFALARFSDMEAVARRAGASHVDGVVMDVGVSSMQLDHAHRGFSFRADGPLDMRMGAAALSAADAVARLSEAELAEVFRVYGEERHARRAAAAIVKARAIEPIVTTGQLADVITRALGPHGGGADGRLHPATRVFQALRILVNDELTELAAGVLAAQRLLAPGGRLVVVTFHSLEDRIVKTLMRRLAGVQDRGSRHAPAAADGPPPALRLAFSGVRAPSDAEVADNPRARSAKLRAAIRTDAAADATLSVADVVPAVTAQARFSVPARAGVCGLREPAPNGASW